MPIWKHSFFLIFASIIMISGCESVQEKGQSLPSKPTKEFIVSGTQTTLSWEDRSTNELGFVIERKTGSAGIYSKIATVEENVMSYTDKELAKGTTYYYRVSAYNADGSSGYSSEICVKVSPD